MGDNGNGRLRGTWQGYTPDTTDDQARRWFERKYGYPPAQVLRNAGAVLAGPIGGNGYRRPTSLLRRVEAAQRTMTPERARQLALQLEEAANDRDTGN
ncbi:MAG: hypothetical protein DRI79_11090 [Chloroflexi bacterium]|nr:MAG: hypothetical protein DRI79_11090 [Chloroflexota bacterium]